MEEKLQERISSLTAELEKLNPNMRAIERLESVENRLKATEQDFENSRTALKEARDAFNTIKAKRFELFNKAFEHIKEQIVAVYKDLTRSEAFPIGGHAYLDIEDDTDTPYLSGIKYHAMPPLKRFRDMEHLSGGEKTIAALALLFAIHSYQPSPFFVLDEVDAALDNANVEKIKKYIREHAGPGMQFIVISLKTGLFQDSQSLVGVYRDQEVNSSKTLTLDVSSRFPYIFLLVSKDRLRTVLPSLQGISTTWLTDDTCSFESMCRLWLGIGEQGGCIWLWHFAAAQGLRLGVVEEVWLHHCSRVSITWLFIL